MDNSNNNDDNQNNRINNLLRSLENFSELSTRDNITINVNYFENIYYGNSNSSNSNSDNQNINLGQINEAISSALGNIPIDSVSVSLEPINNQNNSIINLNEQSIHPLSVEILNNKTELCVGLSNELCSICNDNSENNSTMIWRKNLNCGHTFHRSCIDQWYAEKNICPVCNQIVS
jgi:hypothetical protein